MMQTIVYLLQEGTIIKCRFFLIFFMLFVTTSISSTFASPYFLMDSQEEWETSLESDLVTPIDNTLWNEYMNQANTYFVEGEDYPSTNFLPSQLYVYFRSH